MSNKLQVNGRECNGIQFRSEAAAQLYARTQEDRPPIDVTINIQTSSDRKNKVHAEALFCLENDTPFILYQDSSNYTMVNPSFKALRQIKMGELYNDQQSDGKNFLNSVKMLIMGYDNIVVGQQALEFQKNILLTNRKIL